MNRILIELVRSIIAYAVLSNVFWVEVIFIVVYVRNRFFITALKENEIFYEWWNGRKLDVSYLRVFGCMVYIYVLDSER